MEDEMADGLTFAEMRAFARARRMHTEAPGTWLEIKDMVNGTGQHTEERRRENAPFFDGVQLVPLSDSGAIELVRGADGAAVHLIWEIILPNKEALPKN